MNKEETIHYRGYAYPHPIRMVVTQCTRKARWTESTDVLDQVSCPHCLQALMYRMRLRAKVSA